jgi:hypothetical protein
MASKRSTAQTMVSPMIIWIRFCVMCGTKFETKAALKDCYYCGQACNQKAYRERRDAGLSDSCQTRADPEVLAAWRAKQAQMMKDMGLKR